MSDYEKGREAIEALAPLVTQHGGGKEFAVLVDMVDSLKPKEDAQEPVIPYPLTRTHARNALLVLQHRFRQAVGINVFDTKSEELVRATWGLVAAIVADKNEELDDLYRNSGADSTPDWDAVSELKDHTEIPQELSALLWGLTSKPRESRKGR